MLKDLITGITRVISNITPIIIFFIFVHLLPVNDIGLINYYISLITIIGVITDFGIPEAIQRFLPQTKDRKKLVSYSLLLEFILVTLGILTVLILEKVVGMNISRGYLPLLLISIFFSASNTIVLVFNGLEQKKKLSFYYLLMSSLFVFITFGLYLFLKVPAIESFLIGRIVSWILLTVIPLVDLYKQKLLKVEKDIFNGLKRFNLFTFNTFAYILSGTVLAQWDSIWITNNGGTHENGIYKSVYFIAAAPMVLATIVNTKLLPFFSELNGKGDREELKHQYYRYQVYLVLIMSIIYLIQLPLYKIILPLLIPVEIVEQSGILFPLIFLFTSLYISSAPSVSFLQAVGKERVIREVSIIQTVIFVIASILLYPTVGFSIFPILLSAIYGVFLLTTLYYSYKELK
jgi:O-antigen/teichoic acid export membrane protein